MRFFQAIVRAGGANSANGARASSALACRLDRVRFHRPDRGTPDEKACMLSSCLFGVETSQETRRIEPVSFSALRSNRAVPSSNAGATAAMVPARARSERRRASRFGRARARRRSRWTERQFFRCGNHVSPAGIPWRSGSGVPSGCRHPGPWMALAVSATPRAVRVPSSKRHAFSSFLSGRRCRRACRKEEPRPSSPSEQRRSRKKSRTVHESQRQLVRCATSALRCKSLREARGVKLVKVR